MSEYIDLDTPLEVYVERGGLCTQQIATLRELLDTNKIPYTAADVRPVVLCRDCVNYGEMLSGYDHRLICHKFALTTKPDDFCSRGERRNCGADMMEES